MRTRHSSDADGTRRVSARSRNYDSWLHSRQWFSTLIDWWITIDWFFMNWPNPSKFVSYWNEIIIILSTKLNRYNHDWCVQFFFKWKFDRFLFEFATKPDQLGFSSLIRLQRKIVIGFIYIHMPHRDKELCSYAHNF